MDCNWIRSLGIACVSEGECAVIMAAGHLIFSAAPLDDPMCASCEATVPDGRESILLTGCCHKLCVECAIRCVADTASMEINTDEFYPSHLLNNLICVVPRLQAPICTNNAIDGLTQPSANKYLESTGLSGIEEDA